MAATLGELAKQVQGQVRGDANLKIEGVASLQSAGPHDIVFVANSAYLKDLAGTSAAAVILNEADAAEYSGTVLISNNPHLCFARIATILHAPAAAPAGIHPSAVVHASARLSAGVYVGPNAVIEAEAQLAENVYIGPACYVGRRAQLGAATRLLANVMVCDESILGKRCVVQPGAVIGGDGFGYARDGAAWIKVPQLGRVRIGDDVEIGANTTIDRGALDDTVIGHGVKLDNLIQIGHNVQIGEHTVLAACTGVAGSAIIGKRCAIGGRCNIMGHIQIADDVQVAATSFVKSSISSPGMYSASIPAEPVHQWRKNVARLHQLDDMARRLRRLEQRIEKLTEDNKID